MKKAPIALVAIIVVFAFVGGYFTGIMNSAGNLTLNVRNKTTDSSNYDTPTTYSTNTAKTTKTTASTTPAADTSTPSTPTTPSTPSTDPVQPVVNGT